MATSNLVLFHRLQLLWFTVLCTVLSQSSQGLAQEPFDLVIRNGRVVDGTGNPWFHADLGIVGDRIAVMGKSAGWRAKREIDASGLVVAPGFIDIHSHSDFLLLEDGDAQSKIRQGVTTEVLGEGGSAGPYTGQLQPRQITVGNQNASIRSLRDYFDLIEASTVSVNVASYVGLNNVWRCVRGDSFEPPSEQDLAAMEKLVAQAMADGALGLSSQVMMPPGSLATTDHLIQLCRVAAEAGGIYSTHIRNEGTGVFDSVREAIRIGEQARIPVDIIHLKIADESFWGRMSEVVALIQAARDRHLNVQANVYPYTRGNNNLVSIIPPWAHEGGRERLLERLRNEADRSKMREGILGAVPGWYNHFTAVGKDWSRILVSGNNQYQGLTMDRVMALRMPAAEDAYQLNELFEILLEHDGSVGAVYAHHTEEDMNLAMRQPWCSIGSDGSSYAVSGALRRGNPHPRNFGTFPRVLGVYVRERGILTLEEAVRKMTSLNANKIGLRDRGMLATGKYADITIFDPDEVRDRATYLEPFQYGDGLHYVIVNGELVLENGNHTGARPGRALRRRSPHSSFSRVSE